MVDAARIGGPLPLLDELAASLEQHGSVDRAARDFCERHGCHRTPHGADGKLLLPDLTGSAVLELGPGFGDVTLDLAARARRVVVLAAHETAARIVTRHADLRGVDGIATTVTRRLDRLPFDEAEFGAVLTSDLALMGFGITRRELPQLAAELGRVTEPGGAVLFGQANPLHRTPGLETLRSKWRAGGTRGIDDRLREALASPHGRRWGLGAISKAMQSAGFSQPEVFAPIPDVDNVRAILPVHEPAVVRYFLENLVRRNAPLTRAALALLGLFVRVGLFPRVVPYWFLLFTHRAASPSERGG